MEVQPTNNENRHLTTTLTTMSRYEKMVQVRSEASARKYNNPYPVEKVEFIDWDNPEYAITPNDPRWILPPTIDIGASEWYRKLPEEEQIKIGMYRIAQIIQIGAQFEMALNMGIFSDNMNPRKNAEDVRYSHHEAVEEGHHIMMFLEFLKRMKPTLKEMGVKEVNGAPAWFVAAAPLVTIISRKLPVGFWTVVLTGEEPIDRMQRSLRDYDRSLEKQGREEGRIHPLVRKVMDVHIEEEARHISYAGGYLGKTLEISKEDKESGKVKVGKFGRAVLAATTPLLYDSFAKIILRPSKQSQEDMGIPKDVAKATWWESDQGQEAYHNLFRNAVRRADRDGLRDGEAKSTIGRVAWRLFLGMGDKESGSPARGRRQA
jgi:hypothetical protein